MRKYFSVLTVLLLSANTLVFASQSTKGIEGGYVCKGTDPDSNIIYTCQVKIQKTGLTYSTKSSCDDGTYYNGTGIYDQKKRNLSVVFTNPKNSDEIALAMVEVKKDGSFSTVSTYLNKTSLGHSACTKNKV